MFSYGWLYNILAEGCSERPKEITKIKVNVSASTEVTYLSTPEDALETYMDSLRTANLYLLRGVCLRNEDYMRLVNDTGVAKKILRGC